MNKTTQERYEKAADGTFCIDVAADSAEELYNNFDRNAPFIRRDLDPDLVEYLIDSATELHPQPFLIRFSFTQPPANETFERIQRSINTFFIYGVSREQQLLRRIMYRSSVFLMLGVIILFFTVLINRAPADGSSVIKSLLAEGLNIAAWVALWEALATFLVDWFPYRSQIRLFRKLAQARLLFR